jgi:hypothetical protein
MNHKQLHMAGSTPTVKPNDDNWLGEQGGKLPSTINVLTILTFIANGFGFLWAFVTYARAHANYDSMVKAQENLDKAPDWARKLAGPHPLETAQAMLDNRLPIMIITLISTALCFFGALQMRKLKKNGFSFYILGDIVGYATGIFIGFDTFATIGVGIAIAITILFIILYASQLKYMK